MNAKEIVRTAFPDFKGRKIREDWSGSVTFYDLNWSGGTKNTYRSLEFESGRLRSLPSLPPWANPVEGNSAIIPPGYLVVELSYFCGKGPWARIYYPEHKALAAVTA